MKNEMIFINGIYSDKVPDTAPEYILGKGSIHINSLIKNLEELKPKAVNGYIKYTLAESKSGKRIFSVDQYAMQKYAEYTANNALKKEDDKKAMTPEQEYATLPLDSEGEVINDMTDIQ